MFYKVPWVRWNKLSLFLYVLRILFLLNFLHPILFWLLIELNLLLFIFLCYGSLVIRFLLNSRLLFYFLIQCSASFIFLLCSIIENYCSFSSLVVSILLIASIFFKMGLWPLHFWVYKFVSSGSVVRTFLVLTIQKLPFLLLIFRGNWSVVTFLIVISRIGSVFLIWNRVAFLSLLVSSSIYTTFWFFSMITHSLYFFFTFYLVYRLFTFYGCTFKDINFFELRESGIVATFIIFMIFLLGLPPLSFFLFKFFSVHIYLTYFSFVFLLLSWVLTFGSIIRYFKFFLNFFFISLKSFKIPNSSSLKFTILTTFFFFFFFWDKLV